MATFRSILVLFTVLTMAANPVLAATLGPCCCQGNSLLSCPVCQAAQAEPQTDSPANAECCQSCCHRSCCEMEPASEEAIASDTPFTSPSVTGAGCNCVKAIPPTAVVRDKIALSSVEQLWLSTHAPSVLVQVALPVRPSIPTELCKTPTGPPLLALYCTWLK